MDHLNLMTYAENSAKDGTVKDRQSSLRDIVAGIRLKVVATITRLNVVSVCQVPDMARTGTPSARAARHDNLAE